MGHRIVPLEFSSRLEQWLGDPSDDVSSMYAWSECHAARNAVLNIGGEILFCWSKATSEESKLLVSRNRAFSDSRLVK
jgi:hypothetical protein